MVIQAKVTLTQGTEGKVGGIEAVLTLDRSPILVYLSSKNWTRGKNTNAQEEALRPHSKRRSSPTSRRRLHARRSFTWPHTPKQLGYLDGRGRKKCPELLDPRESDASSEAGKSREKAGGLPRAQGGTEKMMPKTLSQRKEREETSSLWQEFRKLESEKVGPSTRGNTATNVLDLGECSTPTAGGKITAWICAQRRESEEAKYQ